LFARNCRGRTFEDAETMAMVEAAVDHYGTLHRDLFSLRGQKGYTNYKESWTATESLDNVDLEALKEKFTRKVFDERLMDALPVVQRAYEERKNRVGEEFEQWANSVIEEDDDDSVFANSPNPEQSDFDFSGGDAVLDKLFTENGFQFKFLDGKYYFESNQEVERARDIIAAYNPKMKFPPMAVYNYGYGTYGSTTNDYETGTYSSLGMEESTEQGVAEGMFGLSDKEKGSIMNVVEKLSDIPGMWDHKAQTFTDQGMEKLESVLKNNKKYIKYAVNLTADDFEADLEESKDLDSIKRLAGLAK